MGGAAGRHIGLIQHIGEAAQLVALDPSDATLANYAAAVQALGDTPPPNDAAGRLLLVAGDATAAARSILQNYDKLQETEPAFMDKLKALRLTAYGPTGLQTTAPPSDYVPVFSPDISGRVVKFAYDQIGKPYKWAADGPGSYDCSGLTMAAWRAAGVSLPHNSADQYDAVAHISKSDLQPGDLVFYYSPIHHVAIYIGDGHIIHAPKVGEDVQIAAIGIGPIHGYGRP